MLLPSLKERPLELKLSRPKVDIKERWGGTRIRLRKMDEQKNRGKSPCIGIYVSHIYIYTIIYLPDILPKSLWLRIVGVTAVVGGLAPAFAGAAGPGGGAGNNSARKCTNSQAQSRPGCKTP